jgi:hypothetical protein
MSELKVYHHELRHNEYEEFYLKYEADKEIQRLEKLCENYRCDCDNLAIMTDTMRKAGRTLRQKMNHQKYKRCLAMASYWVDVSYRCVDDKHRQSAERHHRKWLELAKKFKDKEAK